MSAVLRVLSLNIWNHEGPWDRRAELIRAAIAELEPDLIGFQEILVGQGIQQAEALAGDAGYHLDFERASAFWLDESLDFGVAIASRWPLLDREGVELPGDGSERRVALSATVDAPFGPVSFTTTHLNWKPQHGWVRERQVLALADLLLRRRPRGGFPPILCGDLNARPESAEMRFLRGLQSLEGRSVYLLDAWEQGGDGGPGITLSHRNAYQEIAAPLDARIDYVLVGPSRPGGPGSVESCRVVCDEARDGVFASDHFGVYAELRAQIER
jgi:endonuclease/exonuclease/phosphatase family metal-dependent hydrolase